MHNIEILNKFLKDELSATETYQQALDKLREDAGLGESKDLRPIYEDHKEAVSVYRHSSVDWEGLPARTQEPGELGRK